eukprot:COSAG01_NODE_734_length_13974_cov_57.831784_12_plen_75_part_00
MYTRNAFADPPMLSQSRFGKFTQILFDTGGNIVGSRVDVYLLEKSRVVHQHEGGPLVSCTVLAYLGMSTVVWCA